MNEKKLITISTAPALRPSVGRFSVAGTGAPSATTAPR